MIKNINNLLPGQKINENLSNSLQPKELPNTKFNEILDNAVKEAKENKDISTPGLSFSKHALNRLKERHIVMDLSKMEKINGAIEKAAKKGSNESLIISEDSAFIVNVPKRRIITAMDKAQMQENVFTNIDSTVIA